ncbi:MAG: hypothetical protein B7O98_05525 [Zestosphaera tikiterensis]|uniref:Uncharacterized protein n=1 Tax=Zestosphaera tikiterensis TaxID=1973259 RepID=A0A2R7Y3P1_9CREN|nr:MAG: hypothetical protein B7O98_05525 [Zestosphaera tikiterensis]
MAVRRRTASARKVIGKKSVKGKVYQYEYYTLPLNLYLPKSMVEKWGTDFIIERDEEAGKITIISSKALATQQK